MVSKKFIYIPIFIIGIFLLLQTSPFAKEGVKDKNKENNSINKTLSQIARTYLDINNISTNHFNNGIGDIDANGNSGLVYPKGSGKTACFTSGLLWGGLVQGDAQPRVGGTAYRTGLQPGIIKSDGTADDPTLDKYRIYRVRRDVMPGGQTVDLTADAFNEGTSSSALLAQYVADWTDWPADLGAPYYDGNHDGVYNNTPVFLRDAQGNVIGIDSTSDIPGVPGADQTIWYVANDMNALKTTNLYGAQPIGIEMQATYWAYNQSGAFGNMYFRKYRLINKGNQHNTVSDMYVSMWADVDLGDAGDDFVGVDTVLSLQYCYNAKAVDQVYSPLPPPAIGFDFFQGPLVNGVAGQDLNKNGVDDAVDFGIFNGKKVGPGKINLPMTAAYYFANGDPNIGDPPQGDIAGSTQFYNFFRGLYGISGAPFIDPTTNKVTTFALNGDPITGKGWLDGTQLPAGDRRQGSASGPFTLAPGDTQEVVVAEICAGATPTSDRLAAIGTLKFFDSFAQLSYDNFFQLPPAPPAPKVDVVELPNQINLDWGEDLGQVTATENFHQQGFKFEGYNVYQLPSQFATKDEAKKIATFDVVNNIQVVLAKVFDPVSSQILLQPAQLGTNSGLKRFLEITQDAVKGGTPLVNGVKYYFAVTAYGVIDNYNGKTPIDSFPTVSNVENPIKIITAIPQAPAPGTIYTSAGQFNGVTHATGLADGSVTVNVVDPSKLTGDTYEIFFTTRSEIRNANGDWVPAGTMRKRTSTLHPDTLTGSSVDMAAVYGPQAGVTQLNFTLNLVSVDADYADGVQLVIPAGVTIVDVPKFTTNNAGALITPDIQGQTINLGRVDHPYTTNGAFAGGETWSVFVKTASLPSPTTPLSVSWTVFDDGYGGGPVDATGTTTDTTIGTLSRTAKYWNIKDSTTNTIKLANQGVLNGTDIYPTRSDYNTGVGENTTATIDGFHVSVNGSYEAPINYLSATFVKGPGSTTSFSHTSDTLGLNVQNYTIFGGTVTSKAIDNFGFGTNDINQLQKDYILKFTGVWDSTVIGGHQVYFIKPGTGSLATIFRANVGLANHPLNPSPGTNAPFLIRIPFEVWSKDDNRQVNLMFRDREQSFSELPFYAWPIHSRSYAIIVNTPYDTVHAIPGTPDPLNALATWVLVFYGTNYSLGDQIDITYANPIQPGLDTYVFTPSKLIYSTAQAKIDVNAINVFPNPYYGVNSEEVNKYNRFVTFSHLPAKATIRIFNLAGVLVQTIEKNDTKQFAQWDLNNQSNLPVASGLYLAYIDMPEIGSTKILKLAIIQEQQILDRF